MTRNKLMEYVARLDPETQRLFMAADEIVLVANDTTSDDFQIAAEVLSVFGRRAASFWEIPHDGAGMADE